MRNQPIHQDDWDYLIVLDACRYDYFKNQYSKYLDGNLEKVRSRGSATPEWLSKTWTKKRYNINYITANPYVNKEGLEIGDLVQHFDSQWYAGNRFTEINQAWVDRWHHKGTVHPEDLKEYSCSKIGRDSVAKCVIHFIQPHRPFLSYEGESSHDWYNRDAALEQVDDQERSLKYRFFEATRPLWAGFFHSLPESLKSRIRGLFGMGNDYRRFADEVGVERVKEYYRKDLNLALENVSELVEQLDGKVVVTADHGESWGENYEWGHPIGSDNPVLREVPWMEVEK